MTDSPPLPPQPRGIDFNLPTCGETRCNDRGRCVLVPGGGVDPVCDCLLGYRGEFCEDTVNEAVSVPLTVGVLVAILGVVIMAFVVAKIRQAVKKKRREAELAAKENNN